MKKYIFTGLMLAAMSGVQAQWTLLGNENDMIGQAVGDEFGTAMAFDGAGNRIAVAAPARNGARGEIRVFEYGADWGLLGSAIVGDSLDEQLGYRLALGGNGNVLVASRLPRNGDAQGKVLTYLRDGNGNWQLAATLSGSQAGDKFGVNIAISADAQRLIIGAPEYRVTSAAPAPPEGRAYLYQWESANTAWRLERVFEAQTNGTFCGKNVTISPDGQAVMVGMGVFDGTNIDSNYRASDARIFVLENGFWAQRESNFSTEWDQDYGYSMAMANHDTFVDLTASVIGAPLGSVSQQRSGMVTILDTQTVISRVIFSPGQNFGDRHGHSVAMSADGNRVVIGAPMHDNAGGTDAGRVQIVDKLSNLWLVTNTKLGDEGFGETGHVVAISNDGRRVAIASPKNLQNKGKVRVYEMPAVAIEEQQNLVNARFYPNPTNEYLNLELAEIPADSELVLFDMIGQSVAQTTINQSITQINIASLPAGTYIAQIQNPQGRLHNQLIIKL